VPLLVLHTHAVGEGVAVGQHPPHHRPQVPLFGRDVPGHQLGDHVDDQLPRVHLGGRAPLAVAGQRGELLLQHVDLVVVAAEHRDGVVLVVGVLRLRRAGITTGLGLLHRLVPRRPLPQPASDDVAGRRVLDGRSQ